MVAELRRVSTRKVLFVVLPALVFGLVDVLSVLGDPSTRASGMIGRAALVALVVAAVLWLLLSGADAGGRRPHRPQPALASWRSCLALAGVSVVGWLLMWAVVGPLDSMNDTYWIIRNPFGVARQHPVVYNMVTSGVVEGMRALTGSLLAGVVTAALLQLALFALVLVWTLRVLAGAGASRGALLALALVLGFLPITANYTFALVKDSAFTAFTVLLVPVLLTIARTRGQCLRRRGFLAITVAATLGFALTRNNALAVVALVGVLIVVLAARERRRALVCVVGIVVIALVPQQIVTRTAGPQKAVESLGVPLQMVGSTLVHDPQCIAPEDARVFEQIMPADAWRAAFRPESVDAVKYKAEFSPDVLQRGRGEFLGAFARTLARCPGPMMAGYRDQTAQLWRWDTVPVGSTSQSFFLEPISNFPADREEIQRDLARQGVVKDPLIGGTVGARMEQAYRAVLDRTPGTGTWVWALVLVTLAFWYRRRAEVIALVSPALLLWATLMAAAPIALPFRYVAYLPWILAIALVVLLSTRAGPQDDTDTDTDTP